MGKAYQEIDERISRWMARQKLFFVATAPRGEGLLNCSPKGMDGLRILDKHTLVYADVGGSGIETVAHLRENGRIVIMLCAFEGPPKIFRFYGQGHAVEPGDTGFAELAKRFEHFPTIRNFVVIEVDTIRDSCGYGVPLYDYQGERDSMQNWVAAKTEEELLEYRRSNNERSLDGLPGLRFEG
ncbi:MAG: pyridoxamine 5'-phosphate oxidase family protein [Pseudomonadota bacterium]